MRNLAVSSSMSSTSLIEQLACVIYFQGQAGSATAEPACRLFSLRNDLQIAEFFEAIFAEFNANP
jgi:hypothetical protein